MSERFDDLLSGAVDSASRAAHEPGAAAARNRGRQRRNRRRLAASTLSLALLGAVGTVAAVSVHGTPNALPAAHASNSAAVTASAAPSAPASPDASASLDSSPATSATATATKSALVVSPNTYVPAAWLSPQQMPLYQPGMVDWTYDTYNYGTHLSGHVYKSDLSHLENWCSETLTVAGSLTSLEHGLAGAQYQSFTGSNSDGILPNRTIPAFTVQVAYFYPNAADATAAMNGLAGDFAGCATHTTGVNPSTGMHLTGSAEQTAVQPDAQCWSVLAASTQRGADFLDHDCFVQSGNVIEEVHLEDNEVVSFSTQSFTATDAGLIPALRQALAAYGG